MKNFKYESAVKRSEMTNARLIWVDSHNDTKIEAEEYCLFRKTFFCDKLPKSAILNIFVQSEYKLYINGEEVMQSSAGTGECAKTDRGDVLSYLKQGKNVIAIFAHYISCQISRIAMREKGIIFDLKLDYTGARNEEIVSDSSVLCAYCSAYTDMAEKNQPRLSAEKTICEVFDNNLYDPEWIQPDFDDSDWTCVTETELSETEYFDIQKSEFKCTQKHIHSAKAIIAAGTGDDIKGLSLTETFCNEVPRCILNKLYVVGTECEIQPMDKGQHSYILVDFARICSGYVRLDIDGYMSDMVDVIFAKELLDGVPQINGAARFILKPENNILETHFDKNEFRYLLLVFRNPVRTNVVKGIWAVETEYPFENTSVFTSDNQAVNDAFESGVRYIKSRFSNNISYIGLQERNTIFSQRVAAVSNCYISGETLHFAEMLKEFASMQIENGRFINKAAPKLSFDFYDLFSFVLSVKDYMGLSNDEQLTEKLSSKLISALKWVSMYENDGFLKKVPDRFNSEALLNITYIYVLEAMAEICASCGPRPAARFYDSKAAKLKKAYKEVYMQDEQVFFEENKELKCDLKALLTLTMGMPLSTDAECDCIINMPLEFIRAVKKSGDNKLIINMLEENKIPEDATVVAIAENILGIDITGKKGIKSSADTESFENIDAEIHTPKGLVAVSVKNKVIEKNTLSVNINQADGEL